MTNKELQDFLKNFSDDFDLKYILDLLLSKLSDSELYHLSDSALGKLYNKFANSMYKMKNLTCQLKKTIPHIDDTKLLDDIDFVLVEFGYEE